MGFVGKGVGRVGDGVGLIGDGVGLIGDVVGLVCNGVGERVMTIVVGVGLEVEIFAPVDPTLLPCSPMTESKKAAAPAATPKPAMTAAKIRNHLTPCALALGVCLPWAICGLWNSLL